MKVFLKSAFIALLCVGNSIVLAHVGQNHAIIMEKVTYAMVEKEQVLKKSDKKDNKENIIKYKHIVQNANDNRVLFNQLTESLKKKITPTMAEKDKQANKGYVVKYRHCIQNINENRTVFKQLSESLKKKVAKGGVYKSIDWMEKCPLPANGKCDYGNHIEYFYAESDAFLKSQKEGCEQTQKKWTTYDVPTTKKGIIITTVRFCNITGYLKNRYDGALTC